MRPSSTYHCNLNLVHQPIFYVLINSTEEGTFDKHMYVKQALSTTSVVHGLLFRKKVLIMGKGAGVIHLPINVYAWQQALQLLQHLFVLAVEVNPSPTAAPAEKGRWFSWMQAGQLKLTTPTSSLEDFAAPLPYK